MSLLETVATHLRERNIPFALIGATAMAVHGVSRSTGDIDLLSVSRECLSAAYWEPLKVKGVEVHIERGDADDPLAGVVRLRSSGQPPLDLVVGKSAWQANILSRAAEATVEGARIPISDRADLILLKLYAGGAQDAWDTVQLLESGERSVIIEEVEQRLAELPEECRRLWARIQSTGGASA